MDSKKYLVISFLPSVLLGFYFLIEVARSAVNPAPMQYGYNPAEFMIEHGYLVLISVFILILFSIITIRKGDRSGWLPLALPVIILAFGGFIYYALSIWKF